MNHSTCMFLFALRFALRSLFLPALLRGVKNLPHYYSRTLLTLGKNKVLMLKVFRRCVGDNFQNCFLLLGELCQKKRNLITILRQITEPIKRLSRAKKILLPLCYRQSPLRRQNVSNDCSYKLFLLSCFLK